MVQAWFTLYQQYDGYPSGVGKQLCKFLKGMKVVDGIQHPKHPVANGPSCLFAQLVCEFKMPHTVGYTYLHPADDESIPGLEEFEYHVDVVEHADYITDGGTGIEVQVLGDGVLFSGTAEDGLRWCEADEEEGDE